MNKLRKTLVLIGVFSLSIAATPWFGLGGYAFNIPGWGTQLPRLNVLDSRVLYDLVCFPLHFVALIPPMDDVVYFQGEGVVPVRPFMVFLFWLLVGIVAFLISLRLRAENTNLVPRC
jgi:hypothetical protein